MTIPYIHKLLCKCDENKGPRSNTRGVYRAYVCKSKIILKCKTCNRKKEYTTGGMINDDNKKYRRDDAGE